MSSHQNKARWRAVAPITMLALVLTACGGNAEDDGTPDATSDATSPAAEETVAGLAAAGTLTLASTGNFPPCTFTDESGEVAGYSIDLGNEMASRLGLELATPTIDFVAELQGVESGLYDLGDGCVNVTEERRTQFDYTVPLGSTTFVALIAEENAGEISGLDDIADRRVGVVEGSSRQQWAIAGESDLGYSDLVGYPGFSQAVLDLENDRIDVIIDDFVASNYYVGENPDAGLMIAGEGVEPTIFAMVMRKGNSDVAEAVNGALSEMLQDGTIGQMQEEWFGEALPTPEGIDDEAPWDLAPTS